jgi:hypothetical protein
VVVEPPVMIETSVVIEVAACPTEIRTSDGTAETLANHTCAAKSAGDAATAFAYMPATESASHIAAAPKAAYVAAAPETASHVAATTTPSHMAATTTVPRGPITSAPADATSSPPLGAKPD